MDFSKNNYSKVRFIEEEFFIEKIDEGKFDFNLWQKIRDIFYNRACMIYGDWSIDPLSQCVNYSAEDIKDELENPLIPIYSHIGNILLNTYEKSKVIEIIKTLIK